MGYNGKISGYYRDMLYIFVAKLFRRKILLNLRFGDADAFSLGVPRLLRPFVRTSLRACWGIVPITEGVAEEVRAIGCKRVEIIPNCVDVKERPNRDGLISPSQGIKILFVGWVNPAKGIHELLQAMAMVEDATLTIIGPLYPPAATDKGTSWPGDVISELGIGNRVTLLGRMEPHAARQAYRKHDVLVLPSHLEGFPNVILEAMEAAMPVIATRVGAISDIIRDNVDGFLIDVGDVDSLANRLNLLKACPGKLLEMGRSGRVRVLKLYSSEIVARAWTKLYRSAAGVNDGDI